MLGTSLSSRLLNSTLMDGVKGCMRGDLPRVDGVKAWASFVMLQPGLATNSIFVLFPCVCWKLFFKPILDFLHRQKRVRVSDQICPHNRVGRSKSQLGGSGGGPGVLGGWGLGNVCLLQMHSNAILGPHPGPSPELTKSPPSIAVLRATRGRKHLKESKNI